MAKDFISSIINKIKKIDHISIIESHLTYTENIISCNDLKYKYYSTRLALGDIKNRIEILESMDLTSKEKDIIDNLKVKYERENNRLKGCTN